MISKFKHFLQDNEYDTDAVECDIHFVSNIHAQNQIIWDALNMG